MHDDAGKVRRLSVSADDSGQRLDNFLFRHLKGVPKGHVYRLLRTGQVRVNSRRCKPEYRLEAGDELRLPPVRQADPAAPAQPREWQRAQLEHAVLFEDAALLVLDKPAGMAVHGGSGQSLGVIELLRAMHPAHATLELVHRLDRDTSGCLVIARKRSALRALHAAIREGRMEKRYLALLTGRWQGGERTVDVALEKNQLQGGERMVRVAADGKAAQSRFRPVSRFADATLVEVTIPTGRTHQIRVHAAHIGHPVAGDEKYGDREANKRFRSLGLKRMFLHAHSLGFTHPVTGEPVVASAPLDENLRAVLDRLETTARAG
ncbi:MAG TPA: 23S rRNA pseudouridine(955/2504/2580) synthase RluC [Gammaproteobacteria bacterium]|nr:23S rRNA pseudouridine(955/2504/2580) synthase RluC [Gammaproteobacteria bacterium]